MYYPIARSVANQPWREATQNARLLAVSGQAMVDATERDAGWLPLIETPMHPECPCAHCTMAASLGAVLKVEIGSGPTPRLSTTSPTLPGVTRTWTSVDAFTQEVINARIYDGVHYRGSGEDGNALGAKVGEASAAKLLH
jgi:hypothetical protein